MIGLLALAAAAAAFPAEITHPRSSDAAELVRLVNDYRADHGLPPVPVSRSLNAVAEAHVRDLMENRPDDGTGFGRGRCNMHSWSSAGPWKPVCYTRDHSRASAMWSKPREITRGAYSGNGYEIAFWSGGEITPEFALYGWRESRGHNDLLVEQGPWRGADWQAMGVAIHGNYAVVWFGKEPDSGGRRTRYAQRGR
jgi:uncharacterized protein YkwD